MTDESSTNGDAEPSGMEPRPAKRAAAAPRRPTARKKARQVATAGGGLGGTLMLSIAQRLPSDNPWGAVLLWASPGFAAVTGYVMPLLKDQGKRWGVQYKVWRSRRSLVKLSKRPDVSEENKDELRLLIAEVDKRRANDEIARVREALSES